MGVHRHALLKPTRLLGYCGYGVWNVKPKRGRPLPPAEWILVPNAHPALITEEEACAIAHARRDRAGESVCAGPNRSRSSPYPLSGGVFVCGRCGSNTIGFRSTRHKPYYVCGSQPYRKSMGCGPGVRVPQALVEGEVVAGMQSLVRQCSDTRGFTRQVNEELRHLWEATDGDHATAQKTLRAAESRIANIRKAVEEGLADVAWANQRMGELMAERASLGAVGPKRAGRRRPSRAQAPRPHVGRRYRVRPSRASGEGTLPRAGGGCEWRGAGRPARTQRCCFHGLPCPSSAV